MLTFKKEISVEFETFLVVGLLCGLFLTFPVFVGHFVSVVL